MVRQSRRRFIGAIAGAGATALAGCNGLLGDGGGGGGLESDAEENTDAVEQGIQESAEDLQDVTVEDVRVEGNVVIVEAVAAEYDI